ncbi:MAG: TonB-dependent receptor [Verrucomicrobia bacterium]|nr:TonB-dependent receptor [Verrucomicrobiota bacterium]
MNSRPIPGLNPRVLLLSLAHLAAAPARRAAAVLLFPAIGLAAASAPTGNLTGRVLNEATGSYLEGAAVALGREGLSTLTNRTGAFEFVGVAPGTYDLLVSYAGLDPQTVPVVLTAGQTTDRQIALTSQIYRLEAVTVTGLREGNAAAITLQKNSPNIVNMLSMDAYGNVADGNIGNFLQRLPGVDQVKGNGDVQGINVRGMEMALSTISLDGAPLSTAYAASSSPVGDRAYQIDNLPAELISSITLTKAPTPNLPADSLGGNIDLVTKSAFEIQGRRITYRAGANYNTDRGDSNWTPTAALTYLDRLGRDTGIGFTASFSRSENTYDRIQNSLAAAPDGSDAIVNTRLRLIDSTVIRDRAGTSLKLERRMSDRLVLRIEGAYTRTENGSERHDYRISGVNRIADYSRVSRAAIEAGGTPRTTANATASLAPGFSTTFEELLNATYQYFTTISPRTNSLYKLAAGGEWKLDRGWVRFKGSHNPSTSHNIFQNFSATFSSPKGVSLDTTRDRHKPVLRQIYGETFFYGADAGKFTGKSVSRQDIQVDDTVDTLQVDWRQDLTLAGRAAYLQSGLNFRGKDFAKRDNTRSFTYVGADGVANNADDTLAAFSLGRPGYAMFHGFYPSFDIFDADKADRLLASNPAHFVPSATNVVRPRSRLEEDVTAAYLMGNLALSRLAVLAGVRVERTEVDGRGSLQINGSPNFTERTTGARYTDWFPGLHLRYTAAPNLLARASWSTGMGRPAISAQVPTTTVDTDVATTIGVGRVTANNVGLKPMYSDNFDLSLEYYFQPVGLLSVGAFEKRIDGFIATRRTLIGPGAGNGFGGQYAGFELVTQQNLTSARVRGLECNYQQDLSGFGRWLRGFGLMGNATLLRTSGQYDDGLSRLPGFKPYAANAGLSFRQGRFQARALYNYNSGFLSGYSDNPISRTYSTEDKTLDINFEYRLNRGLTLFFDANNVFNFSPGSYIINKSHVLIYESNGTRLSVGISGRL